MGAVVTAEPGPLREVNGWATENGEHCNAPGPVRTAHPRWTLPTAPVSCRGGRRLAGNAASWAVTVREDAELRRSSGSATLARNASSGIVIVKAAPGRRSGRAHD